MEFGDIIEMGKTESSRGEFLTQTQDDRNQGILAAWLPRWVWSTAANFDGIRKEFEAGKKYGLTDHKDKHKGPAVIVGAGPSLTKQLPILKDCKIPFFVPESMAYVMSYNERKPEYIGAYDGGRALVFLENETWKESTLLTHPAAVAPLLKWWKWKKLYYLMMHIPRVNISKIQPNWTMNELIGYVQNQSVGQEFFSMINPLLFPYITARILNAGCVVNNMIQIAHFMGYDPLFLIGCDFGYPGDVGRTYHYTVPRRFPLEPRWMWKKRWTEFHPGKVSEICRPLHISDNGIKTTEEQVEYKIALMSVYKLDRPQLIDCSEGTITELPKADFREVVKNDGRGFDKIYRTDSEIQRCADDYFSRIEKNADVRNVDRKSETVRTTDKSDGGGAGRKAKSAKTA